MPGTSINDQQARPYMSPRQTLTQQTAAARARFSASTGSRLDADPTLPSQQARPRGRRRPDSLATIWEAELVPMLTAMPELRPVTLFDEMRRRHPARPEGIRGTLDPRLRQQQLRFPKLRQGSCFPSFLDLRKTSVRALLAVIQEAWIGGVSARRVDELVQAMGLSGISKSTVSKLCKGIDEGVGGLLKRRLEGEWPYLWPDATCLRQREGGGTVSIAAIVAVAVNTERRREIVGLHIDPSEAERLWSSFLKSLVRRGLKGVRLVISDAHAGLNAAIARVRVRDGKGVAFTGCARPWPTFQRDRRPWYWRRCAKPSCNPTKPVRGLSGGTADHLRPRFPKLAALMDDNEHDVLAYLAFLVQHRSKLDSVNPLERLDKEVKRRADVVGIFPNEGFIVRLIGAVPMECNDEWTVRTRYMQVEAMVELLAPTIDAEPAQITADAA